MKLRNFSPVVVSLLVGAAIGYCFGPSSEPSRSERPEPAPGTRMRRAARRTRRQSLT